MSGAFVDGLPAQEKISLGWCKLNTLCIPGFAPTAGAVNKALPKIDLLALAEDDAWAKIAQTLLLTHNDQACVAVSLDCTILGKRSCLHVIMRIDSIERCTHIHPRTMYCVLLKGAILTPDKRRESHSFHALLNLEGEAVNVDREMCLTLFTTQAEQDDDLNM